MQLARVLGTATATIKHPTLTGWKLLLVQPWQTDGKTPDGEPLLVVDGVGAGMGDTVLITTDRRAARTLLKSDSTPVCWTAIGIRD